MNDPTEEKIQWLWEQYGFKKRYITYPKGENIFIGWKFPSGECRLKLPLATLNNLFKYACPLMRRVFIDINNEYLGKKRNKVRVLYKGSFYDGEGEQLEDALFWAIYKALGGKE